MPRGVDPVGRVQISARTCPPPFHATAASTCILAQPAARCDYPEADCACVAPAQCGGAFKPHPLGSPGEWRCAPKHAGVLRADGCSFTPPANGAGCATSGKTCEYGPCSWSRTIATCKGGMWAVMQHNGPPPP